MKFFMPVYAAALTIAVASSVFEQAAGAACTADATCPTGAVCGTIADGTGTPAPLAKPDTLTCSGSKKAFISTLKVSPTGTLDAGVYGVTYTKDGTTAVGPLLLTGATSPQFTAVKDTGACDNYYSDIGKDATGNVAAKVGCPTGTSSCALKYTATWACQVDACTASSGTTGTATTAAPLKIERPSPETACTTGKYAYLSSFEIAPGGTTTADKYTVKFTSGADSTLTTHASTKDYTTCDGQYTNVGKTDAKGSVVATVTCSAASCDVKYKATWTCQAADATPAPTTAAPSSAVTYPVAAWGTALVAAVAGANFAAPL